MTAATASKVSSKVTAAKNVLAVAGIAAAIAPSALAVVVPKVSAGDAAIEASKKVGVTNSQLLKAVWSTRGNIHVTVPGFDFGVAIIKSDLTGMLKALPPAEAAAFTLTPRDGKDGGADLVAIPAK